ncbi:hypothetical protein [Streptomyces sp. YU58]|uniref:hypothetical protein n=1 Tax=Streptomyces sp. SX92 TaxID=3158972 RepID=UPI0027B9CFDF|nr:hypothetical protein [Streptomyces coralus]WLW51018.1 hypothetical protein QU709_06430 [Streptomyces coralus]
MPSRSLIGDGQEPRKVLAAEARQVGVAHAGHRELGPDTPKTVAAGNPQRAGHADAG